MTMKEIEVPERLSDWLGMALADLQACEADSRYDINMYYWHTALSEDSEVCLVCLAGAVMAKRLRASPDRDFTPGQFVCGDKLRALDYLRTGNVDRAVEEFYGGEKSTQLYDCLTAKYEDDRDAFFGSMLDLQALLAAEGL